MKKAFSFLKSKKVVSFALTFVIAISVFSSVPVFAATVPQKQNSASSAIMQLYSQKNFIKYYDDIINYVYTHETAQFTNSKLYISMNASKGSLGNATSITLILKQNGNIIFKSSVPTDGQGHLISSGKVTVDTSKVVDIYMIANGSDVCIANTSLVILSDT